MTVLGLDLSLTAPGAAGPGGAGTLHTDSKRGDKRFCDIRDWMIDQVHGRNLQLALIEAVPPYDFASSGLERVHGVAREVLARYDIPFAYVNVSALKRFATGDGRADKAEVMRIVQEEWCIDVEDDNAADAAVLRAMGELFINGIGLLGAGASKLTATMGAVPWPLRPADPGWPQPYGELRRKPVTRQCKHGLVCLKNADHWLHPFDVAICDKPPKTTRASA